MAESNEPSVKNDVFIVYSSKNKADVTNIIISVLEEAGLRVTYDDDFLPGRSTFKNITEAVFSSKKTLIYLTRESLTSTWCRLELIVALEKTQKTNVHSVVLLLNGLEPKEVETFNFLRIAQKVDMNPENTAWKADLVKELKAEVAIRDVLPVGNVGHGYAYSHFNGFLQYVLPELKKMITSSKWYKPNRMPIAIFELIPQSCNYPPDLANIDPGIERVTILEEMVHHSSGNLRVIKVPLYRITDEDGTEYFCVCEYPSVIRALYVMDEYHLANITDVERRLQLVRFYYTMNAILNNTCLGEGAGRGKLLLFNDEKEKPKDVLLKAIKRELGEAPVAENNDVTDALSRLTSGVQTLYMRDECEFDAFVACPGESDIKVGEEIVEYLKKNNISCLFSRDMPGKTTIQCILEGIRKCRWFILVYSKNVMDDKWLSFECLQAIQKSVTENNIRLIPVLNGVDHTKIPDSLAWVTFVNSADELYLKKIQSALKNIPLELETMLPAGNVSDGLAWGYFANYLEFILPALVEKIRTVFNVKENIQCPEKLLLLIPRSCECPAKLTDADERITNHKHVIIEEKEMGGDKRSYHCDIYKIENYYFFGQFPASIQCLRNMCDLKIAGLKETDMQREAKSFCEKVQLILQTQNLTDKCSFLTYDNKTQRAGDVILAEIQSTFGLI